MCKIYTLPSVHSFVHWFASMTSIYVYINFDANISTVRGGEQGELIGIHLAMRHYWLDLTRGGGGFVSTRIVGNTEL